MTSGKQHSTVGGPLALNGDRFFAGNVGIGTTSPSARLSITGFGTAASTTLVIADGDNNPYAVFQDNGSVGIATSTPTETLSVAGTVGFHALTGATGAGSLCLAADGEVVYNAASDSCLPSLRETKDHITPLTLSAIDTITALESVSFAYLNSDGRTRYGFIAEDVALVDPLLATYNADGIISGIDDRSMVAVLIKGVQELWEVVRGFAKSVKTEELCLENLCLTKQELQHILDQTGTTPATPSQPTPKVDDELEEDHEVEDGDADEPADPADL